MTRPSLYIREIKGKGRGVFSSTPIQENDLVEECPLIEIPAEDFDAVTSTHVVNYCFFLNKEQNILSVALGFGSIYNHAFPCNAHHMIDREAKTITFFALRDIKPGEEITINYNGDPQNDSLHWFTARDIEYKP
jgi:SET domain-containing protein